jgi:hypothetical protein
MDRGVPTEAAVLAGAVVAAAPADIRTAAVAAADAKAAAILVEAAATAAETAAAVRAAVAVAAEAKWLRVHLPKATTMMPITTAAPATNRIIVEIAATVIGIVTNHPT